MREFLASTFDQVNKTTRLKRIEEMPDVLVGKEKKMDGGGRD